MTGLPYWASTRDLVIACALLGGYAWLAVLSARIRAVSRRLGSHICREPDTGGAGGHSEGRGRVDAADILRRERGTPRPMLPQTAAARTPAAAAVEVTRPMPVVRTDDDDREERYW